MSRVPGAARSRRATSTPSRPPIAHVEHGHLGRLVGRQPQRGVAVLGLEHPVAELLQPAHHQVPDVRVVVRGQGEGLDGALHQ